MAIIAKCPVHGDTSHTSASECIKCREEKEYQALKEWESLPLYHKLRDLYIRIKKLENSKPAFY